MVRGVREGRGGARSGGSSASWQPGGWSCLSVCWSSPGDNAVSSLMAADWRSCVTAGWDHLQCRGLCGWDGCCRCPGGRGERHQQSSLLWGKRLSKDEMSSCTWNKSLQCYWYAKLYNLFQSIKWQYLSTYNEKGTFHRVHWWNFSQGATYLWCNFFSSVFTAFICIYISAIKVNALNIYIKF